MIQSDWQQILGWLVLGGSGIGGLIWGGKTAWTKFRSGKNVDVERAADEPAPEGAVQWVADICTAMGSAPDTSKLAALLVGATRDEARKFRIAELEAKP